MMVKKYTNLIDISLSLLPDINDSKSKHFTFLLKRKKIISIGYNKTKKSHPICYKYGHKFNAIHSEVDAILKASRYLQTLNNLILVNIRLSTLSLIKSKPILRMSKPCIACRKLIASIPQIKHIYYSINNNNFELLEQE